MTYIIDRVKLGELEVTGGVEFVKVRLDELQTKGSTYFAHQILEIAIWCANQPFNKTIEVLC
ncbi:MAG: hypothetical protein IJW63_03145 [Lachnospiraceae bacterium]|nr:hypothetical protein [Lachnospiraceae bacterium]